MDSLLVGTVNVYPNPASTNLNVDINMNDQLDHEVTIQLVNMLGQVMISNQEVVSGGRIISTLNLGSELNDGIYTLRVIAGDQILSERVIINNDK